MDNTAQAYIVIGSSGSGKTFLANSVANASSLPTYVINGNDHDFNSERFEHITYNEFNDDIDDFKNSILIIDDVVRPSDFESKVINEILVKHKRHSNITVFCLAHALEKNNLHSLIQHFDYVVFTNNVKNTPVFKVYITRYCPKDKQLCKNIWDNFISKDEYKTHYLRYNNKESKFEIIDIKCNVLQNTESKLRQEIYRYIEPNNDYIKESMALFDYLIKKLPPGSVSEDDHILKLKNPDTSEIKEVNIVDIVYWPPRKKLDREPPNNVITAFQSLQKLYNIPHCFLGNRFFYEKKK